MIRVRKQDFELTGRLKWSESNEERRYLPESDGAWVGSTATAAASAAAATWAALLSSDLERLWEGIDGSRASSACIMDCPSKPNGKGTGSLLSCLDWLVSLGLCR